MAEIEHEDYPAERLLEEAFRKWKRKRGVGPSFAGIELA
jgi:hypothetical protein